MFDAPSAEEGRLAVTDGDRLDAWRDALADGVAAGEVPGVVGEEIAASCERLARAVIETDESSLRGGA